VLGGGRGRREREAGRDTFRKRNVLTAFIAIYKFGLLDILVWISALPFT
jgi:hypothetical protein